MRKGFVIEAKEGMVEDYIDRHKKVWKELEFVLKGHGVNNYSIFHRKDSSLFFGYMEVEDEGLFRKLEEEEICKDWWLYMTEVLICESPASKKGKEETLIEVYHLQ